MKQLLQRLDTGATELREVPVPGSDGKALLVRSRASAVSVGTERMLVDFGRSTLLEKARQQPDKVKQVLDKARAEGVAATVEAVRSKLQMPIALGYCNAGEVVHGACGFQSGDRVVTNGPHAEYVRVGANLAARIPDGVEFETAAFTPLAAIALQGMRLADPTLGETFVVYGLGLVGQLAVQLLTANGCRVIGIDTDAARLELTEEWGGVGVDASSEDVVARVLTATAGRGADGVLLTLASSSDEPARFAAQMSRKRGRLVLVGVTGLNLRRGDFYEKELSFTVSCSYGPGRYDPRYEEKGQDYPLPFVRWTEQRNFEAVLDMMALGRIDPSRLITHRIPFAEAPTAYEMLVSGREEALGVVFEYPEASSAEPAEESVVLVAPERIAGDVAVGVVGAGNFAMRTLLPALSQTDAALRAIASISGTSASVAARKFGFGSATTDVDAILSDDAIDAVLVLTRHDTHASLVRRALEAGKHVFVEKPLALSEEELRSVESAARAGGRQLLVGFNRRFAPFSRTAHEHIQGRSGPLTVLATVNAGKIPREHWVHDPKIGGGRIVGEASHWIDLARYLVGAPIQRLQVTAAHDAVGVAIDDIAHLSLGFEDGSTAVVSYVASGSSSFPKERIECHFDGRSLVIDNWRKLVGYGIPNSRSNLLRRSDKGHRAEMEAWLAAIRGAHASPIPLEELIEVSAWAIRAGNEARGGGAAELEPNLDD